MSVPENPALQMCVYCGLPIGGGHAAFYGSPGEPPDAVSHFNKGRCTELANEQIKFLSNSPEGFFRCPECKVTFANKGFLKPGTHTCNAVKLNPLPVELTSAQKIMAIKYRFYDHMRWVPDVGDYFCLTRDGLELFRIKARIQSRDPNEDLHCKYPEVPCFDVKFVRPNDPQGDQSNYVFAEEGFTTRHFGPSRVWVPDWVFVNFTEQKS